MALGQGGDATIMVVDDEPANVLLVSRVLARYGYRDIVTFTESREALNAFASVAPDLVVLDLHMPEVDGYGVMDALDSAVQPGDYLPVLVLTADVTPTARKRSFRCGACDFLTKPIDAVELGMRVASLLETRALNLRLAAAAAGPVRAAEQAAVVATSEDPQEGLARLRRALAVVDDEPASVNERVGRFAVAVAEAAGLDRSFAELLGEAATLHDVGKVGVPAHLLGQTAELTAADRLQVETHCEKGAMLLAPYAGHPVADLAALITRAHHEHFDGSGYPDGLAGDAIPLAARIVAIADAYASSVQEAGPASWVARAAMGRIMAGAGSLYDPALVAAFVAAMETLSAAA